MGARGIGNPRRHHCAWVNIRAGRPWSPHSFFCSKETRKPHTIRCGAFLLYWLDYSLMSSVLTFSICARASRLSVFPFASPYPSTDRTIELSFT